MQIEEQLSDFVKSSFGIDGLTFEFIPNLSGAFSNKSKLIKLPKYEEIDEEKLDILKCLIVHEVCHLKFSDFDFDFDESVAGLKPISLILEDIAVERNMVEENPHIIEHLKRLNLSYVYRYFIKNKNYGSMNVDDLCLRKLFTTFSRTEHCPMAVVKNAVPEQIKELAQEKFMKLRKAIPEAFSLDTRPKTTKACEDLARKVIDFFGDFEKPSYYFGA